VPVPQSSLGGFALKQRQPIEPCRQLRHVIHAPKVISIQAIAAPANATTDIPIDKQVHDARESQQNKAAEHGASRIKRSSFLSTPRSLHMLFVLASLFHGFRSAWRSHRSRPVTGTVRQLRAHTCC
jgi:hypothetical protein